MKLIKTYPGNTDFHLFENAGKLFYPAGSLRHQQSENINKEFLEGCYVLLKEGSVQARAALYLNDQLQWQGIKTACIGNYESAEDHIVSEQLINHIILEAKNKGAGFLIGPMNGSTWDNYRFSTHHTYTNFLLEPYHHLYYNDQFLNSGFLPIAHYSSSIDRQKVFHPSALLKREEELLKAGMSIRKIDMNHYEEELLKLYPFISNAFKTNFLYTPVHWKTFRNRYVEAAKIIDPDFVLIAMDKQEHIVGFIFAYPDLFNTIEKSLVVKTVARDEAKQWGGVGHILSNKIMGKAIQQGYQSVIHALMINHASSTGLSNDFLGTIYKNYVLYGINI